MFCVQLAGMKRPSPEPADTSLAKIQKKPKAQKKKKKRDPNEPQKWVQEKHIVNKCIQNGNKSFNRLKTSSRNQFHVKEPPQKCFIGYWELNTFLVRLSLRSGFIVAQFITVLFLSCFVLYVLLFCILLLNMILL